jgi:hypothetical protein
MEPAVKSMDSVNGVEIISDEINPKAGISFTR